MQRPDIVTDEHLQFLDLLRESGKINMFGAVPYLKKEFAIPQEQAEEILCYWMDSFGGRSKMKNGYIKYQGNNNKNIDMG